MQKNSVFQNSDCVLNGKGSSLVLVLQAVCVPKFGSLPEDWQLNSWTSQNSLQVGGSLKVGHAGLCVDRNDVNLEMC